MSAIWAPSDILMHHGIKGQRWGVRRYQNKNGSLTPLGKKRYEKKIKEDIDQKLNDRSEEINELKSMASSVVDKSMLVNKNLEKDLPSVEMDNRTKDLIWSQLEKDFGGIDQVDDFEFFYEVAEEYVDAALLKYVYDRKDTKDYLEYQEKYWNQVKAFTKSVLDDYKNVSVDSEIVEEKIANKLDSSFMAYVYKHFDDYWVRDTDAYSEAVTRLTKDFLSEKLEID